MALATPPPIPPPLGKLSIPQWHMNDRPRERLLAQGSHCLSLAELLACCLGSGVQGEDAVSLAARLLAQFGGLEGVLAAPTAKLMACRGVGYAKVSVIKAIRELALRHDENALLNEAVAYSSTREVCRYVQRRIGHEEREVFACLFLNARHQLLAWEILFWGSIDRAHVHAREVLKRGLQLNAAAVVFCHNHPSGVAEPSQADLSLTSQLMDLLAKVDIKVLDHIIVSAGSTVSMAARGLMPG